MRMWERIFDMTGLDEGFPLIEAQTTRHLRTRISEHSGISPIRGIPRGTLI